MMRATKPPRNSNVAIARMVGTAAMTTPVLADIT
jgi:hypothetical protein